MRAFRSKNDKQQHAFRVESLNANAENLRAFSKTFNDAMQMVQQFGGKYASDLDTLHAAVLKQYQKVEMVHFEKTVSTEKLARILKKNSMKGRLQRTCETSAGFLLYFCTASVPHYDEMTALADVKDQRGLYRYVKFLVEDGLLNRVNRSKYFVTEMGREALRAAAK